ncbi:response regulator transcription factor [Microbacteriaceae bacterium VKM Ac-2854]|nr:response regulator transcription factor [Microbacteriaceae bacterium VKM Ac-2854]
MSGLPADARIRVALVDDQALFRSGLAMLISSQSDLELVGEAGDGAEAIQLIDAVQPDVVLMDLRMPVMDGVQATARIVAAQESSGVETPRIVVLTTFRHDEAVVAALRAGASGFILKDATSDFVLEAIRTVHSGQAVIAPPMTRELLRQFGSTTPTAGADVESLLGPLSPRERDIFLLAAKGLSNAEVAASAFLGETTVKTHMRSILAKLSLRDRVQLVVFAHEKGLV